MTIPVLKISGQTASKTIAGAINSALQTSNKVELHAIGAAAVNQAVKAIAIASGFAAPLGKRLSCVPAFSEAIVEENEKSIIKLIVTAE